MDQLISMGGSVGALLKERGETVAVAESSAGGLVSAALLSVPGASAYFVGGGVIYTRDARRGFMASDEAVMRALDEAAVSFLVVLTKTDKLKPAALERLMGECETVLKSHVAAYPLALPTSARSGHGIAELRAHLGALAGAAAIH